MSSILYSFRRCPYAMRARYAIAYLDVPVQLREVVLKNKPAELLELGGRSTVPQLLDDGQRYPESLDIIFWALERAEDKEVINCLWPNDGKLQANIMAWIRFNDDCFKPWLDRYKYADRHPEHTETFYREKGERFLKRIESRLSHQAYLRGDTLSLADIAVFPFIRQFAGVDSKWFEQSHYPALRRWLNGLLEGELFQRIMKKYPAWQSDQEPTYFP
ncbi:glutathione S-transferase [Rhodanobacter aciditrophus]|uniref:Glutathione S-transferase n=1 Tax=Rhodanobacter aciditrophus TaxID=1623218 RepID=A0ABW4B4Z0_9GAMM